MSKKRGVILVYDEQAAVVRKGEPLDKPYHKPVLLGDRVKDFRGDWMVIKGVERPFHEASTGRVYCVDTDEAGSYEGADTMRYFPSVVNAKWWPL